MTLALHIISWPYVQFALAEYRLMRFFRQPELQIRRALRAPSWLAELILAGQLFALGTLLAQRDGNALLGRVAPIEIWIAVLLGVGGTHLMSLFWGVARLRWTCAFLEAWIYACLLIAFGGLSANPRPSVACFGVSFAVSLLIPFTLRDPDGKS